MTTSAETESLFAPVVEPRTSAIPKVSVVAPAPRAQPAERRAAGSPEAGGRGRHSMDGGQWDDTLTVPLRITALGVRPYARGGQHRRPGPRTRITSLDGLRGIAALVVVVYHVFLTQPALAEPYRNPAGHVDGTTWWATFTPLHLAWAGPEAVLVFFVLSGLVLALPVADTGRLNLWDYYPRRLVRLYLPVWAAVGLTVLWATVVPRVWPDGSSWWIAEKATEPTGSKVLADLMLVWSPGQANHVLWSLQWEVLYCLVLPLVLVALRRAPRGWAVKLGLVVAALLLGSVAGNLALASLPLFVLGTLMAVEHRRLVAWADVLDGSPRARLWWALAMAACVVLLLSYWFVHALPLPAAAVDTAEDVARVLQGLGAGLVVAVVWLCPGARAAMTAPVMQWLGSRSFSLYLVHLPVVATVALLLDGRPPLLIALAGTLVVTLPLTEAFYRFVERPSHRIARRAGRVVAERARSAPAPEVVPAIAETGPIRRIPAARASDPAGAAPGGSAPDRGADRFRGATPAGGFTGVQPAEPGGGPRRPGAGPVGARAGALFDVPQRRSGPTPVRGVPVAVGLRRGPSGTPPGGLFRTPDPRPESGRGLH